MWGDRDGGMTCSKVRFEPLYMGRIVSQVLYPIASIVLIGKNRCVGFLGHIYVLVGSRFHTRTRFKIASVIIRVNNMLHYAAACLHV